MEQGTTGQGERAAHDMERAEQIIRRHAAQLAEHPRHAQVEVTRYASPWLTGKASIHLSAAFPDEGIEIEGIDHTALSRLVEKETGLEVDPEYTGVFRWKRRKMIVYWWDWCLGDHDEARAD